MKTAVITLTKGGADLGRRLIHYFPKGDLYVLPKFLTDDRKEKSINGKLSDLVGEVFSQYSYLIFIMATGIVVRTIVPYLKDKKQDPGIVVLDEKGKNVISLLSGHIGGANELTLKIADFLGANPVITTASDINNSIAVDTLAMSHKCIIEDFKEATRITAHIVNGEAVGILSDIPILTDIPKNLVLLEKKNIHAVVFKGLIYITEKSVEHDLACDKVILRPKNLIVGIGCKRGKTKIEILGALEKAFAEARLSIKSIKKIATVDLKKDETGILETADYLGVPLQIINREEIAKIEDQFIPSNFVKETIGVGSVCEPVALLSAKKGLLIQEKKAYQGITIAVVKEGELSNGNHNRWD
ncbi:MAG: cobalt-precorrin 5A hydrolase [Thermotaleaceae bacterium]